MWLQNDLTIWKYTYAAIIYFLVNIFKNLFNHLKMWIPNYNNNEQFLPQFHYHKQLLSFPGYPCWNLKVISDGMLSPLDSKRLWPNLLVVYTYVCQQLQRHLLYDTYTHNIYTYIARLQCFRYWSLTLGYIYKFLWYTHTSGYSYVNYRLPTLRTGGRKKRILYRLLDNYR